MTRRLTACIAISLVVATLAFDLATESLNPFNAPAPIVLGSGKPGGGAFCGELPG
ncbi:MAG: hypothetical protein OXF74_07430 [Rhodobacteraceae bacterium]|nr:hypothetical protein [Paracoccaceae bacterium]